MICLGQELVETLHQAFLAGGDRVGHVPMGKQMPGAEKHDVGITGWTMDQNLPVQLVVVAFSLSFYQ